MQISICKITKNDILETSKSKLDKETLLNSYDDFTMIFEDKAKLLMYSRKLSTTDEAQIKELMKRGRNDNV